MYDGLLKFYLLLILYCVLLVVPFFLLNFSYFSMALVYVICICVINVFVIIILFICISCSFLFSEHKAVSKTLLTLMAIMVIFKCYFSREHIALSYKKWCEHGIRKNEQINGTAHDGKSYLK